MQMDKCFFCNKVTFTPYHVTDISDNGEVESCSMCENCGFEFLKDVKISKEKNDPKKDLSHIKTPEQLLQFLYDSQKLSTQISSCKCGTTKIEFDKNGRFGCQECYDHFYSEIKKLSYSYHNADKHIGKFPKNYESQEDITEKLKLLKLKYAKALELEEYEKLTDLKKEIDKINKSLK